MLVKYAANRRTGDGSSNIRIRSTGKTLKFGSIGEVTEEEFRALSATVLLEVVGGTEDAPKELDDMTLDDLKRVAELENVEVEDKRSKKGYVDAISANREQQEAGTGLPATAPTGNPSDAGSPAGNVGNSAPAGDGGGTPVV